MVRFSSESEVQRTKEAIWNFLERTPSDNFAPSSLIDDLAGLVIFYRDHYVLRNDGEKAERMNRLYEQILSNPSPTFADAKNFLSELESPQGTGRIYAARGQGLERRMAYLEREIAELRSNPAIESKLDRIKQEISELRAQATKKEKSSKEQKDMLKEYKEAREKVFVIMPFAPFFDDVWKGAIERACGNKEYGCLRVDKISLSSWITDDIVNYIDMADFVVADTTGSNPNVMFELGWALALKKKPIVIRQKDDPNTVPFDVKDIRFISYVNSWSGIETLFKEICEFLQSTSESVAEETAKPVTKEKVHRILSAQPKKT